MQRVLSFVGIGAFDQIPCSHNGRTSVDVLRASVYLWEDDVGDIHTTHQGEGGEQGDLMPFFVCPWPTQCTRRNPGEFGRRHQHHKFPKRACFSPTPVYSHPDQWRENADVESSWSQPGCVRETPPQAMDDRMGLPKLHPLLLSKQTWAFPHPCLEIRFLRDRPQNVVKKIGDQRTLLDRIPLLADLQASWLLLLHCATTRANCLLPVVEPGAAAQHATSHDEGLWN